MKKGILVCLGEGKLKNIGDYIQSMAAGQFAGKDAVRLERENLHVYGGDPVKVIMNAWFMHHPRHFPPTSAIRPCFLAFHVEPSVEDDFFTEATTSYLKAHEPIGCRSKDAVAMLRRHGIRAEFTSCMTLTLADTYRHVPEDTPPVFVDPHLDFLPKRGLVKIMVRLFRRMPIIVRKFGTVRILAKKFHVFLEWPHIRFGIVRYIYAAEFIHSYAPFFGEELLARADYVSHMIDRKRCPNEEDFFALADSLLKRYAKAPFVVTSRLHCALPCTGIGIPVWMVYHDSFASGRYGGNLDFLNRLEFAANGCVRAVTAGCDDARGRFPSGTVPPVRTEHLPFAESLRTRSRKFMQDA